VWHGMAKLGPGCRCFQRLKLEILKSRKKINKSRLSRNTKLLTNLT